MSVAQIVKLLQITYISVKGLYKWVLLSNCIANALKKGFFLTLGFRRLFVLPFREQLMEKWIKTRQINQKRRPSGFVKFNKGFIEKWWKLRLKIKGKALKNYSICSSRRKCKTSDQNLNSKHKTRKFWHKASLSQAKYYLGYLSKIGPNKKPWYINLSSNKVFFRNENIWYIRISVASQSIGQSPEVTLYLYQLWRHIYANNDVTAIAQSIGTQVWNQTNNVLLFFFL